MRGLKASPSEDPPYIYCPCCKDNFWSYKLDIMSMRSKPRKGSTKISRKCPYCDQRDFEEHEASGKLMCKCCQSLFDNCDDGCSRKKKKVKAKQRKPSIVLDPKALHGIMKSLSRCPVCKGLSIASTSFGVRCQTCKASWRPDPMQPIDDNVNDYFWEAYCPRCESTGANIAQLKNGDLHCCACQNTWSYGGLKKTSSSNTTLCHHCKGGFLNKGRCMRCGKASNEAGVFYICPGCKQQYSDPTQRLGLCDTCKEEKRKTKPKLLQCPDCNYEQQLEDSILFAECGQCESHYSFSISKKDSQSYSVKDNELTDDEEAYLRFKEKADIRSELLNDAMDLLRNVQELLFNELDVTEEFGDLETTMQDLCEIDSYIKDGSDYYSSDSSDYNNSDIWRPENSQSERWLNFNEQQRWLRKFHESYNEVSIEDIDSGKDLLYGERICYHRQQAVCTDCYGYVNDKGTCESCNKSYIIQPEEVCEEVEE